MISRSKKHLLLPLLAVGMTIAMAASAQAQDRQYNGSTRPALSLQISFGSAPHWDNVRGTNVMEIRRGERSDYDMFRYGRSYYAYNNANGRWYMSRRYRGQFRLIDDRSVPSQLRRIPRDHWRNYPTAWEDRGPQGSPGSYFQVSFGTAPRWSGISGTRVEGIYGADHPSYDVFRYGGTYYAYNNSHWYTSTTESGRFAMMDDHAVPVELTQVPRENWRNYPPAWGQNGNPGNGNGRGKGNGRGNGHSGN